MAPEQGHEGVWEIVSQSRNGASIPVSIELPDVCMQVGIKHLPTHLLHMEVRKPVAVARWRPNGSYPRSGAEVVAEVKGYLR
jgi:hypothetical protein